MRILHTVEFYHPSVGGMQEVVKQLSERLVGRGHDVTVATTALSARTGDVVNGVKVREFNVSGKLATGLSGDVELYRDFVAAGDFDIVTNFAAQQWATDAVIDILPRITAKKVFVPTGFSSLYDPVFAGYFESMRSWLHHYDMNVFLSEDYRDINFARECGVGNVMVIPNGAAEDEFLPETAIDIRKHLGIDGSDFLILHVGSHTGIKGHAEAIEIFAKARISDATLLIIANNFGGGCTKSCKLKQALFSFWPPHKMNRKRLLVRSLPRKETVAAYKAADLFLFPSNIECSPLVLFEAMAGRTPFLTTDVGNAAEITKWSGGGIVLPTSRDPEGYSRADISGSTHILEQVVGSVTKRESMAESGHNAWLNSFTWDKIAKTYEDLYCTLHNGGTVS